MDFKPWDWKRSSAVVGQRWRMLSQQPQRMKDVWWHLWEIRTLQEETSWAPDIKDFKINQGRQNVFLPNIFSNQPIVLQSISFYELQLTSSDTFFPRLLVTTAQFQEKTHTVKKKKKNKHQPYCTVSKNKLAASIKISAVVTSIRYPGDQHGCSILY